MRGTAAHRWGRWRSDRACVRCGPVTLLHAGKRGARQSTTHSKMVATFGAPQVRPRRRRRPGWCAAGGRPGVAGAGRAGGGLCGSPGRAGSRAGSQTKMRNTARAPRPPGSVQGRFGRHGATCAARGAAANAARVRGATPATCADWEPGNTESDDSRVGACWPAVPRRTCPGYSSFTSRSYIYYSRGPSVRASILFHTDTTV